VRFKTACVVVLVVALFPALATGVAEQLVRAVLQAAGNLVGGSGG
jgi:hypothetical protein